MLALELCEGVAFGQAPAELVDELVHSAFLIVRSPNTPIGATRLLRCFSCWGFSVPFHSMIRVYSRENLHQLHRADPNSRFQGRDPWNLKSGTWN
jgi:hypothetical protein